MESTIKIAKEEITNALKTYLEKNDAGEYRIPAMGRLPIYLYGLPGIGKTEIVQQVAEEAGVGYVSFSLTHHTRNSLLGLPVIRELPDGRKYTEFTMSEIIASVEKASNSGHKEGILMLDEFNSVSDTVLPTMLAFLQTKNIGEYTRPAGWVIMLAGNPVEYNSSAKALDMALLDRVRKIEIEFNSDVFLEYAESKCFHPAIIGYIQNNPSDCYLMKPDAKNPEAVTARGWENLSRTLYAMDDIGIAVTENLVAQFIKSDRIVYQFMDYLTLLSVGCSQSDIEIIVTLGKKMDDYAEKWRDLPETTLWLLADHFYRFIIATKDRGKDYRKAFDNVFLFLDKLGNRMVTERAFGKVNQNKELVMDLALSKNTTYLRLCKEILNS